MKVGVCFTPADASPNNLSGATAVVIDVVRATSCIVEAAASGARAVLPAVSIEEAVRLRASLDDDRALLCGERRGVRIDGFDLGNSPAEFTPANVSGRRLVMTTTNGTIALAAAEAADRVLVGSFLNLGAVAEAVRGDRALVIVCAGKDGEFGLDDALCAGHIALAAMRGAEDRAVLDDRALAAVRLARSVTVTAEALGRCAAGRLLADIGHEDDLALCARVDSHKIVPMMRDREITVPSP